MNWVWGMVIGNLLTKKKMSQIVWSVNILLGIGLIGLAWSIYSILIYAHKENVSIQSKKNSESN